ncbi:MAG TPA: leucyl/phenylalanyl-tRNA--protein transferase [Lapillicoccus sp.]|nr:leucyl/phenylalanyl-tRNA--protein transferase [Lapillicoccus sp.]
MPVVPPPSRYVFDATGAEPGEDLVGVGADLAPGTVLEAYAKGLFPMGLGRDGAPPIGWWSPDPRGILRPADLHVSRSLRRSLRGFEVCVDTDFAGVVAGCAEPSRTGRWITSEIVEAYSELHRMGWAHSIEVRRDGRLVGGLYGIAIGGLFAGESMFHRETDASKAAVAGLVDIVAADGDSRRIVDVQWRTPHLATLGVTEVPRAEYLRLLAGALTAPLPAPFR